ncbi:hypothetical protein BGZ63DRAFT_423908 [Mariannaea sp. PMI_226]|nr:hypothetical protein BGZ63DRAFT_423908 [Mariannaea sp. PMI_226]
MQITSMIAIILATGALAAPPKPNKPNKPPPPPPVLQQITCSSGAPYCCTAESDGGKKGSDGGNVKFECSVLAGTCNSIAVCCNTNNGQQTCTGLGSASITITGSGNSGGGKKGGKGGKGGEPTVE